MSKTKKKQKTKSYTLPEFMKEYFPNQEITSEEIVDQIITKETFYDVLARVSRERLIDHNAEKSKTSK